MAGEMDAAMPPLDHETFLRRAFALAQRARSHGNHPFGAILVSGTGEILLEAENGYMLDRDAAFADDHALPSPSRGEGAVGCAMLPARL
jgi:tRNA(Arg) A34 adenosine deaminase TadA